ncbi:hypothetical protein M408DRAFT_327024 [Serendipita vermifera MAFF 305830]|uniref:Uncharacterized protein n=1 Tax=Serendipita vermifera MAFF 305830 TaxID=933852 RepID=A0A0C3BLY3_SERVB|nr:hypothetical protein M408DRAFT_327024 [Serendipita vermifera MAFF 305830]
MDMSNYPPNARENTTGARDGTILDLSEDIGSVNFIQGTSMAMPDGTTLANVAAHHEGK